MRIAVIAAVACGVLLCGCAGIKGVTPGSRFDAGDGVSVQTDIAWANVYGPTVSGTLWTIDGYGLNELRFLTGISSGKPLLQAGVSTKGLGTYSPDMLPNDVMELVGSTLVKIGNLQVQTAGIRPAPFGVSMGFRFDLSYVTSDGLLMRGEALFAQRLGKLDLILYLAPSEYYFEHNLPVVEQVFASVRVPDNA